MTHLIAIQVQNLELGEEAEETNLHRNLPIYLVIVGMELMKILHTGKR